MTNYIYALHCPIAKTVRYIGKTNDPEYRLASHLTSAKSGKYSHYTARWLRKILAAGHRPKMEILETLEDSEPWEDYERFYIQFGDEFGWKLTNTNPGGEGGGFVREEDKARWAESIRASYTPEVRARMSARLKEVLANPRTKELHRTNMQKRWKDPEYRDSMAQHSRRVNADPEVKAKRRIISKERMANPSARQNVADKLSAFYATEEGRANKIEVSRLPEKIASHVAGQVKNWEDPAYRHRIMAAKTTPEVIQKQKDKAKYQWADPVIRAKMVEANKIAQRARAERNRRTPEEEAVWCEERLAKRRQQRADESPEVREGRLAKRREQRRLAKSTPDV